MKTNKAQFRFKAGRGGPGFKPAGRQLLFSRWNFCSLAFAIVLLAALFGPSGLQEAVAEKTDSLEDLSRRKEKILSKFLGKIYALDHKYDRAERSLLRALKADPDNLSLRAELAEVYLEAGRKDDARRQYQRIAQLARQKLNTAGRDEKIEIIEGLSLIPGEPVRKLLTELLEDSDFEIKLSAAVALGKRGDETAIVVLMRILERGDSRHIGSAINILSRMKVRRALPAIVPYLSSDYRLGRRRTAASCLGTMGDPAALEYLLPYLNDDEYQMRKTTAYALWKLKDLRAGPALIESLQDPVAIVRKMAAYSLGKLEDRRAVDPLKKMLNDTAESDHLYAGLALAEMGILVDPEIFLEGLNARDFFYRGTAIEGLAAVGNPQTAAAIIPSLKDNNLWVRSLAAKTLIGLKLEESKGSLEAALSDESEWVRAYAAAALLNLEDREGEEVLNYLLTSPVHKHREAAADALKYLEDKPRSRLLPEALTDPSRIIRQLAEEAR